MKKFTNEYISVSRIKRYEQCPLSFKLSYIDKKKSTKSDALDLGVFLHSVLEDLYNWIIEEEFIGELDWELIERFYRDCWEKHDTIAGAYTFLEGLEMLKKYMSGRMIVDCYSILAVEKEFNLRITIDGKSRIINGKIDRVDKVDEETVRVIDYKSNRMPFSAGEIKEDIQLAVYSYVAKKLWPWAKNVLLEFHMLRLGIVQRANQKTDEECENVIKYMFAIANRTENQYTEFNAKLNPYCCYCGQSDNCPTYHDIVNGKVGLYKLKTFPPTHDINELSKYRELIASLNGIVFKRKKELDDILKAKLEREQDITVGDTVYYISVPQDTTYDAIKLIEVLESFGAQKDDILLDVMTVGKEKLKEFVAKLREKLDVADRAKLTASIMRVEKKEPSTPRLNTRKAKLLEDTSTMNLEKSRLVSAKKRH